MYFLSVIVLCILFLQIYGRPTHVLQDYDKDSKENSYRYSDSGDSDDYQINVQKSSLKQFAGNEPVSKADLQDENSPNTNEEVNHVRPDKDYLENNDEEQADAAHLSHNDLSIGNDVKRTAAYSNGIILFPDNGKSRKIHTKEYNDDDNVEPSQHTRYLNQYNTIHNAVNRDRRQIKNNDLNEPFGTGEISTQKVELNGNEDEETAIRRHVKKLTKEELDELLQSLSEDKRALLKNIMDDNSQHEYDTINKREITKKAGANEENSLVSNEQTDTNKIQGGTANLEAESSMVSSFDKEDNTKKTDTDSMDSKSTEIANSSEKSNDKINVLDSIAEKKLVKSDNLENVQSSETESKILESPESEKETSKKEKKRETNSKSFIESELSIEPASSKSLNKEDLFCSENEELSQLWNEESNLFNDQKYKREVCPADIDSMKSLEESFPNADNTNSFKTGSDMAPLVRVKRTNLDKIVEKRDANTLSNLKVPYFSSALENNEEGSDEGGEFQDDGFFDRGANFAKSSEIAKHDTVISKDIGENNIKHCRNFQPAHMTKHKLETDTVSLGSDTDVVLSGIEGVDDNMMYNSAARIRRTGDLFDDVNIESESSKFKQGNQEQLGSQSEDNELSEGYNSAARYQENDSFDSFPRNYERDLGRFKRIRRLKP